MLIDENGNLITSEKEKCNLSARTFQKSFNHMAEYPYTNTNCDPIPSSKTLNDVEFTIFDVLRVLRYMPNKNSTSPDKIPYILL